LPDNCPVVKRGGVSIFSYYNELGDCRADVGSRHHLTPSHYSGYAETVMINRLNKHHSGPAVSVVIPTCDRCDTLVRALLSVYAQTRPPAEIIVVDDGSTDGTQEKVEQEFPEVSLVRQSNRGVSAARNRGIAEVSGEWIAFLDSDDEWKPEKLEKQLVELGKDSAAPLCHTNEIWIRNGRRVNEGKRHAKAGGRIFQRCLPLCVISPSASIVRQSLFDEVGLFDESLPVCEDYDMWLRICARYPVSFVADRLTIKYGGHADQLSRSFPAMDRYRIRAIEKILEEGILQEEDREAAVTMLRKKINVYMDGAKKRDRTDETELYLTMLTKYDPQAE
jgi:glycosyltransferase involved in cell wall biosynthesis